MQSEAPSDQGSTPHPPTHDTTPPSAKRRRHSPRSSNATSEQSEPSNVPTSSRTPGTLRVSPQRRGSSRESEMHRSATPPETGAIKYTRTGRVSKASKGQRVHHCEECGKIYTRAEHLRRHQQNHKPGAFVCDIPGCSRSFYREDLLVRHKERHNDPLDPPTRRGSVGSATSPSNFGGPSLAGAPPPPSLPPSAGTDRDADNVSDDLPPSAPTTAPQQSSSTRAPRKDYIPITELQPVASQISISTNGNGAYTEYPLGVFFEPSPPYSPNGYDSPPNEYNYTSGPPYYGQPHLARARNGSAADAFGGYGPPYASSRSPVSAGSSATYMPQWGPGAPQSPAPLGHFASSASSDVAYGNGSSADIYSNVFGEHLIPVWSNGVVRMMPPEERDAMEIDQLLIPTDSPSSSTEAFGLDGSAFTNEQRYLGSYWMFVHPLFPVVHKLSFDLQTASPLLKSAMLALGAHFLQTHNDMNNAKIIHERAAKVLKRRNLNNWHTYRVCDMQAILLHEVYSIFKSRRPPLQVSKDFEDIYRFLLNDPESISPDTASSLHDSPMATRGSSFDDYSDTMLPNLTGKCKQRLLLACYILDQSHATLFGRQRANCMTATGIAGINLPFAGFQSDWDALPEQSLEMRFRRQSSGLLPYEQLYQAMSPVPLMTEISDQPHDTFQSMLMLAALTDPTNELQVYGFPPADDTVDPASILYAVEQTPKARLAYHTYMLCRHTPIRDLLAVAGESWVMSEKMSSANDFTASQLTARDWATGANAIPSVYGLDGEQQSESPVERALFNALQILDIHRNYPKSGCLFQEWSIYLASVVIWARAYISSSSRQRKPRLSIPSPTEPRLSSFELDKAIAAIIGAGNTAALGWNEAKNVLLWVKGQIEKVDVPHCCGLTNGALDVLGKLVTRGNEEGWFA